MSLSRQELLIQYLDTCSFTCPHTVGINGAKNAGLLAVQILATSDKELAEKLNVFRSKQKDTVLEKTEKLKTLGVEKNI